MHDSYVSFGLFACICCKCGFVYYYNMNLLRELATVLVVISVALITATNNQIKIIYRYTFSKQKKGSYIGIDAGIYWQQAPMTPISHESF